LGTIPAGDETISNRQLKWRVPAWLEPGLLLTFVVGLVIGTGLGALIVGLL
jgi:hypothetical protein